MSSSMSQVLSTFSVGNVWDRASMVAMNPSDRAAYVDCILSVIPTGGSILLQSFSYDQAQMRGPPWSIDEELARASYEGKADLLLLEVEDVSHELDTKGGKWKSLTALWEPTMILKKL